MLVNFSTRYRVECKIGEGSFSEVLKCQDRQTGCFVAAKILKKTFSSQVQALELPEMIAFNKLTIHPNILQMFGSYFDSMNGKLTLISELMDMSLYDLITCRKSGRSSISEQKAKSYLYQIVKGVDHMHRHGIFHRDIKPENILVKGDRLKLSDLGSVKGIHAKGPHTEYISTRWYRSPECILTNGYYGPKMDVWALGCVFYEMLTLKPLFPGSSEVDQIAKINYVLGAPSSRLIAKFRKHNWRKCWGCVVGRRGTGLDPLLPQVSDNCRDLLRQAIVYDPDRRINSRRLLDHKYFAHLREEEVMRREERRQPGAARSLTRGKPKMERRIPLDKGVRAEGRPNDVSLRNMMPTMRMLKVIGVYHRTRHNVKIQDIWMP